MRSRAGSAGVSVWWLLLLAASMSCVQVLGDFTPKGTSGSGGMCSSCTADTDCHETAPGRCAVDTCDMAVHCCTTTFLTGVHAPPAAQTPGDCQIVECDGTANGKSVEDPTDVPASGECLHGVCSAGSPQHNPIAGQCTMGGAVCGDPTNPVVSGTCIGCNTGADCTDPNKPACAGYVCAPLICADGSKDGTETDVDCGGPVCAKCPDTDRCSVGSDCRSGVCAVGPTCAAETCCQTPTCNDGVKNGNETDVDCGGGPFMGAPACPKCAYDEACTTATDCVGNVCVNNPCPPGVFACCAASCNDGVKNGLETDTDCGGPTCPGCSIGQSCVASGDCAGLANGTTACTGGKCTFLCNAGWGNCDGKSDCNSSFSDKGSCGYCGNACSAYCVNGMCNDPVAVAAGSYHTCAILKDGSVWCWGEDSYGQLGDAPGMPNAVLPRKVAGLPLAATAVAAGSQNSCVILSDQSVWCWGSNDWGELQLHNDFTAHAGPQATTMLGQVTAVSIGNGHACAIGAVGNHLYCWGGNGGGQLGAGNHTDSTDPISPLGTAAVVAVATGLSHTCAITSGSGTIQCWGANGSGQLGDGTTTANPSPGNPLVSGMIGGPVLSNAITVQSQARATFTCASTLAGDTCWGDNSLGQLCNGLLPPPTPSNVLVAPTPVPLPAGATTGVVGGHSRGVVANGGRYMCGNNDAGVLGDGTFTSQGAFEAIANPPNVISLSIGAGHACALTKVGGTHEIRCWGQGSGGELGNGMTINTPSPIPVIWP